VDGRRPFGIHHIVPLEGLEKKELQKIRFPYFRV